MDEELSRLEELAALGDPHAIKKLRRLRRQIAAKPKKFFHCLTWNQIWKLLHFDYEKVSESYMEYIADISHEMVEEKLKANKISGDEIEEARDKLDEFRFRIHDLCGEKLFRKVLHATEDLVENMVDAINDWGKRGIQISSERSERHKTGIAVELFSLENNSSNSGSVHLDNPAFCFQLFRPFLAVHSEAAYAVFSVGDAGLKLSDMKGSSVIRVGRWISEADGSFSDNLYLEGIDLYPSIYELDRIERELKNG